MEGFAANIIPTNDIKSEDDSEDSIGFDSDMSETEAADQREHMRELEMRGEILSHSEQYSIDEEAFTCDHCGKMFNTASRLNNHPCKSENKVKPLDPKLEPKIDFNKEALEYMQNMQLKVTELMQNHEDNVSKIMAGQTSAIPVIANATAAQLSNNECKQLASLNSYIQTELPKKVVKEVAANINREIGDMATSFSPNF